MIESQTIKPGNLLSATRELSKNLGVNRSAVYSTYQYLNSLDYLESKPGSYTTIRKRFKWVQNHEIT